MRYYLKNIYPYKEMCHMMTMTSASDIESDPREGDDDEMQVERAQHQPPTTQKFYRALGFSFSANDVFLRDKKRLITSHAIFASELLRVVPDQVHFGPLQLYDAWGKET